ILSPAAEPAALQLQITMFVTHLECTSCTTRFGAGQLHTVCSKCGKPIYVRYDLEAIRGQIRREDFHLREASLWRYSELLPVPGKVKTVSLGEGWTPLLQASRLAESVGLSQLWIKDESRNPTASFKARGMAVAVTMARHLGVKKLAAPSAGNAAGALAAYAARAGLEAYLFMPKDTPEANLIECAAAGAHVILVDGLITDCARELAKQKNGQGWFDLSTMKEPYRVEGKKTLGYELAEQLDWLLPDVVVYPTGGGTGLVGMWKAFSEMETLGWIGQKRPRMIAVQAAGCQPIVTAFQKNRRFATEYPNAATKAAGLRVPRAIADYLILDAVRASRGDAIAVTDDEMIDAAREIGQLEGLFVAPESGACWAALKRLRQKNVIHPDESVVLFNTGSGLKYLECFGI
ncbi:MAG: threonine synthase, partial [Chthoniobacterales bacterium]